MIAFLKPKNGKLNNTAAGSSAPKRTKLGRFALGVYAFFIALSSSQAAHFCENAKTPSGLDFKWCIDTDDKQPNSNELVYFLHGAGGSESVWASSPAYQRVRDIWVKERKSIPSVISVSFGPIWLLTDVQRKNSRPLHSVFTQEVMPMIEGKYGIRFPKRMLVGESMGGFNASQLLLKDEGLFAKVALVCPALPTIGPFSTEAEINAYINRNRPHIRPDWVRGILALTRGEFPTKKDWDEHDPFQNLNRLSARSASLLISCTMRDEHGFYEGSEKFAFEAKQRGVMTQWVPIRDGGHCAQTESSVSAIAHFLQGG